MTHWVNYLPEVGRPIIRRGEELEAAAARIGQLERELREACISHQKQKAELEQHVRLHWSQKEINDAEMLMLRDAGVIKAETSA